MKFSLSWLADYLDTDLDLAALEEALTMAGLEVEDIDDPAAKLADFTVAHVLQAEKHPDADKLRVCRVATKDGEKQIVCGAPNARTGLIGIYAPLGTFIPGLDFALDKKPRKIRGVESHGMLCSAKEIEAGDDHAGIVDLKTDFPVGTPAAEALGVNDPVIDFEVTPNRPDWLGVRGIARDLAACGAGTFKDRPVEPKPGGFAQPVTVRLDAPDLCPAFAARLIKGVKNGPSPDWMQARLRAVGVQPKNMLVDVTNFISLDRARPLHVFDAAKLRGDLVVRRGVAGESFVGLDDKEHPVSPEMCVIADDSGVVSLGGVMGGASTGCSDDTVDVLIESAWFDPLATARAGRATGVTSDAQYRFARGVDPQTILPGIELATALILEHCGGEASETRLFGEIPAPPKPIKFPLTEVKRLTGLTLSREEIVRILETLGFSVEGGARAKALSVTPPSWRMDVEGPADLVEEVARCHGFDKLPVAPLPRPTGRRAPAVTPAQRRAATVRRTLAGRGLQEAVTWSFCLGAHADLFGGEPSLALANPISSELDRMRPTPLIHLITAAQRNADRGFHGAALFEVGPAYRGIEPEDQHRVAAGVRAPDKARHWAGAPEGDVYSVKADAEAVLEAAGAPVGKVQIAPPAEPWWHPGRAGVFQLGPKNRLARFGEVHPRVLKALDVEGPIYAFEVDLDAIPHPKASGSRAKGKLDVAELMPVRRDFAFVVTKDIPAGDLVRAAQGADKALIERVDIFDVYEGEHVGEGRKSIALEVTLQPRDATLDDAALEQVSGKIVKAVEKATGAHLRD